MNSPFNSDNYNRLRIRLKIPYKNDTERKHSAANIIDSNGDWHDSTTLTLCTVPRRNLLFFLRGLCPDIGFDRYYVHTIDNKGNLLYTGIEQSLLKFNQTSKLWNFFQPKLWNITMSGEVHGVITSSSAFETFLIGRHQVSFEQAQDHECFRGQMLQEIKLSVCKKGEFTCDSGHCISITTRCDQTPHCPDKSDEKDCKIIIMENNYNQNIAPFTVDEEQHIVPLLVNISAEVVDILSVNEVEQSFKLKIILLMSWYDYRLTYHNLKINRMSNIPTYDEVINLWVPAIIFDNTKYNDVTNLDNLVTISLAREVEPSQSEDHIVDEIEIFKGSENKIIYERGFTKTLKCIYQLHRYPFDTQVCTVNLKVGKFQRRLMKIIPEQIEMLSKTVLTQYYVTDWSLVYKNEGNS